MRATLTDNITGERIPVRSTTQHIAAEYGCAVWVDNANKAYFPCEEDHPPRYGIEMNDCERTRLEIGKAISAARNEAGITARSLAKATGVHYSNISRIESGDINATIDTLAKLCTALGVTLRIEYT